MCFLALSYVWKILWLKFINIFLENKEKYMDRAKDMSGWEVGFAKSRPDWGRCFMLKLVWTKWNPFRLLKGLKWLVIALVVRQLSQADYNHSRLYPLTFSYDLLEQGPPVSMSKPDKERSSESEQLWVHLIYLSNHNAFKASVCKDQASTSYQSGRSKSQVGHSEMFVCSL